MTRPLRIEYKGAWYHVINRGAGRRYVFHTSKFKAMFLELLAECNEQFQIEVHSYCLMGNHYHLLIRTPEANLSKAMHHLNGVFAKRYNIIKHSDGPIFRGRFKSIVVEAENYLLHLSRYTNNPKVFGIFSNVIFRVLPRLNCRQYQGLLAKFNRGSTRKITR